MSNLALVGYRATGKSTIGPIVADRLGWSFLDADLELERRMGRSIASFFAEGNEPEFRDRESALLDELSQRDKLVLSTGGGCILRPENRAFLRRCGLVVWLHAPLDVLAERLTSAPGQRPSLTGHGLVQEIDQVLSARVPLYREVSDAAFDTSAKTPEEVADAIVAAWKSRLFGEPRP